MPKIPDHKDAELRRMIRDVLAIDPIITISGIQKSLKKKVGHELDENYVKKLVKKIINEMAVVADQDQVAERVSRLRERNRVICEELFRIAFPSPTVLERPSVNERIRALELISKIELSQLNAEMALGVFTKQLGEVNINHRLKPIEPDSLIQVVEAFKAWSQPPEMRKIERREIKVVEPIQSTNEQPKPTTTTTTAIASTIPVDTTARLVPVE